MHHNCILTNAITATNTDIEQLYANGNKNVANVEAKNTTQITAQVQSTNASTAKENMRHGTQKVR